MPLGAISPILILLLGAVAALVIGIFLPRAKQWWNAVLCVLVLAAAGIAAVPKLAAPPGLVFDGSYAMDGPALWTLLILLAGTALVAGLALPTFRRDAREAEFYALMLFALLGAVMLAGAHDVMEILLGVLLASVGSYAMVAYRRGDPAAMEAVLKYYLFGALTNIGLLYGLVLLYGLTGSTLLGEIGTAVDPANAGLLTVGTVLVLVGLGFKAGYVPAHFWIPDTYQGTSAAVAAFLSAIPKIAAVLALARIVAAFPPEQMAWAPLVAGVSAVTMSWGNIAAFRQTDIRRLLGYSTIAQTGYLLMGVVALGGSPLALPGLVYYFAAYVAANIGAFAVISASGRFTLAAHRGLIRQAPWLAVAMLVALLSLTGIPPLAGFVGKLVLFVAAVDAGYAWLTVVGLINSLLSLYYYLRVIAPMFLTREPAEAPEPPRPAVIVAVLAAALSLALGVGAGFVFVPTMTLAS